MTGPATSSSATDRRLGSPPPGPAWDRRRRAGPAAAARARNAALRRGLHPRREQRLVDRQRLRAAALPGVTAPDPPRRRAPVALARPRPGPAAWQAVPAGRPGAPP